MTDPDEVYRKAIAAGLSEGHAAELAAVEAGEAGPTGAPTGSHDEDAQPSD